MRKICFITGSRAEYGILSPLMKAVKDSPEAILQTIATNMHLSPEYGMTAEEIERDGFTIDERVECLLSSDTPVGTVKSMGLAQIGLADAFARLRPDLVVILGDRYEMLAAASAALIFRIPIAHLHGGETTEGAYDDAIRHAITKLSWLHFASTGKYASRIVKMGEEPERVFWSGSLGAENIRHEPLMGLTELEASIGFTLGDKFCVVTYHPVTTQPGQEEKQTADFLAALEPEMKKGWKFLITMPNSDTGGRAVAHTITEWASHFPDCVKTVSSLGRKRFYTALHFAAAMLGNSSSGLIEAPSFGIPTLNVGDRQKGRDHSESVITVGTSTAEVSKGLDIILSDRFREEARHYPNPYEKEGTLAFILDKLLHAPLGGLKSFHE